MVTPLVIGVGVVIGSIAIIAAVEYSRSSHSKHSEQTHESSREPDISSVTKLGPCCFCDGDVDVLNGYRAPCNHLVHYTCANLLSREISGRHNIDWSIVCRTCARERANKSRTKRM